MRPLRILAVAVTLAAANCPPGALRAQEQQPSPESMAAAQALFALLFTHGFATLNAQAVEAAWPGIESALRTQRPNIDPATLVDLRREFERIRLARLSEVVKDIPTIYARHLNAEDMRVLAAFYGTATGNVAGDAKGPAGSIRQRAAAHAAHDGGDAGFLPQAPARARPAQLTAKRSCRLQRTRCNGPPACGRDERMTSATPSCFPLAQANEFDTSSSNEDGGRHESWRARGPA